MKFISTKPHRTISAHHVYVCLVKSFHLKTVLSHVKSYFHTARQNNHSSKLFQRNSVNAKSLLRMFHKQRVKSSHWLLDTSKQSLLFSPKRSSSRKACTTGDNQGRQQFLQCPNTFHSLRWRFWSVQRWQSYKELNLTEFCTWCLSQNS